MSQSGELFACRVRCRGAAHEAYLSLSGGIDGSCSLQLCNCSLLFDGPALQCCFQRPTGHHIKQGQQPHFVAKAKHADHMRLRLSFDAMCLLRQVWDRTPHDLFVGPNAKVSKVELYANSGNFVIKFTCLVASALPACGVPLDADTHFMQRHILQALPEFAG